jgi:K+ transporter
VVVLEISSQSTRQLSKIAAERHEERSYRLGPTCTMGRETEMWQPPSITQMLPERHGILPRNLILVEVTHRKVPYVRDDRYRVTVFNRDHQRGSIIAVEVSFGFMEEPNVERLLEEMARHKEIDLPTDRRQWRNIEQGRINAKLKDGVMILTLPKAEKATRKINISER